MNFTLNKIVALAADGAHIFQKEYHRRNLNGSKRNR